MISKEQTSCSSGWVTPEERRREKRKSALRALYYSTLCTCMIFIIFMTLPGALCLIRREHQYYGSHTLLGVAIGITALLVGARFVPIIATAIGALLNLIDIVIDGAVRFLLFMVFGAVLGDIAISLEQNLTQCWINSTDNPRGLLELRQPMLIIGLLSIIFIAVLVSAFIYAIEDCDT